MKSYNQEITESRSAGFNFFFVDYSRNRKDLHAKNRALEALIQSWGKVIVGYSGGVDSTLVAFIANKVLGKNALIVLAATETITEKMSILHGQ